MAESMDERGLQAGILDKDPEDGEHLGHGARAASKASEPASRTHGRLPRLVAVIDACAAAPDGTAQAVLDDLCDAFNFYAHWQASEDFPVPQVTRCALNDAHGPNAMDGAEGTPCAEATEGRADVLVMSVDAASCATEDEARGLVARAARAGSAAQGARVYAALILPGCDIADSYEPYDLLQDACFSLGLAWQGALAVTAAPLRRTFARTARMGILRRGLSETTDELILRIRCGDEAGLIAARPPVPRALFGLACALVEHREQARAAM